MDSSGDCALIYFLSLEEHLAEQYLPSTASVFPAEGVSQFLQSSCVVLRWSVGLAQWGRDASP